MASSSNTNSVEELITCVICHESFDDPRLLPCSHTYCRKCIEEKASDNKDQFKCPMRDGTLVVKNDIQSLPLNQVARDLVELYNSTPRSIQCTECQSKTADYGCTMCSDDRFCSDCYQTVHAARVMQKHQRVPIAEKAVEMIPCEKHPEERLRYWCHICRMLICSDCKYQAHNDHLHDPLRKVAGEFEAKVNNEFEAIQSSLDNRMNVAQTLINDINNDIKSSTAKIKETMSLLRQMIDDHEQKIVEQILTIKTKEKEQIENYKLILRNDIQSLNLMEAMLKVRLFAKDDTKLLKATQGFDNYIRKTNKALTILPTPITIFYRLEGLHLLEVINEKIMQCGRYVESNNQELQKLIVDSGTTQQLILNGKKLIDQDMKIVADALRKPTTLTVLYLHQNQIGDLGAQLLAGALKQNKTVTYLHLYQNQIGDRGAQHLADALKQNKTLNYIHLYQNQIGDQGAEDLADALKQNTTLLYLYLHQNKIGDQGAQHFADALKQNKTLTQLYLQQNQIGDLGIQYLADGLKNNTTLTNLNLKENKFSQKAMQRVKEMLETNTKLTITW